MGRLLNLLSLSHHELRMKVNTLDNEVETLKSIIKDDLYKEFMEQINDSLLTEQLKEENKRLRKKIKVLKEERRNNGKGISCEP